MKKLTVNLIRNSEEIKSLIKISNFVIGLISLGFSLSLFEMLFAGFRFTHSINEVTASAFGSAFYINMVAVLLLIFGGCCMASVWRK